MRWWLLITVFCFTHPAQVGAQHHLSKTLSFQSLTIDDGLSQGMVTCIMQDRYGFMWFATKDGLNRYDGYHFVVYRHDAGDQGSIGDNFVHAIFEDSKGRIWVGTGSQGLDLFDRQTETFTHCRHDAKDKRSICSNNILEIKEDREGVLYVSTINGLCTIDVSKTDAGKEKILFTLIDNRYFCKVFAPHKGIVWVAPAKGALYTIQKKGDNSRLIKQAFCKQTHAGSLTAAAVINVQAFAYDSVHHTVYLMHNNRITRYDERRDQYEEIAKNTFNATLLSNPAILDTAGFIWISEYGKLLQYDINTGATALIKADNPRHELMAKSTNCIFKDRGGVVWIGTAGYGLLKYNAQVDNFHHTGHESIRWLKENRNGAVMVVTDGDVAWLFDKKLGTFTGCIPDSSFIGKQDPNFAIDAAEQDESGIYWLGKQKFIRYDAARKQVSYLAHGRSFTFPLYLSRDGCIWFATDSSLCSYDKASRKFTHYPFPITVANDPYKFIEAIYTQNDSIFWLGTINGLFRFNKNNRSWKQYHHNPSDPTSLSFDVIFSLCPDPVYPGRYLWIGTNGGGFNRFEYATGKFLRYSTKDGLPNDVVYGILSDHNNLWMSTNKGLSRFNPARRVFHNYEMKDGLQSNEFNRYAFCKTTDGTLFFGGVNGFNFFKPENISNNLIPPAMVITDLKIGNKPVTIHSNEKLLHRPMYLTQKLTLQYRFNMISFDFTAMDFSQTEKNQYQYKLDGFDKEWIQSGNMHSATYTNLDPGTYTFRVKGTNSDGTWNEAGTSVELVILPPWYLTWWFRLVILTIICFVAYGFHRYRLQEALKLEVIRNKIASDLHDEVGSNLSTISIFSDVAKEQLDGQPASLLLSKISYYTHRSMEALSDIVWMINTRNDRLENIIIHMRELAAELCEAKKSALHMQIDEHLNALKLGMQERKNFWLIYKESLNNISKYADSKNVWIRLSSLQGNVLLQVKDDGKGFDLSASAIGNGLRNMQERAGALKGTLKILSAPGKGTTIELSFKYIH